MTGPVAPGPDATALGFSLVELLVALTICALLSGAIAVVAPQARAAFDTTPEVLDLQQRERTVAHVLSAAIRSATWIAALGADGAVGEIVPAVELLDADENGEWFRTLRVLAITGSGRGVLDSDQAGRSGPLRLRPECPATGSVCGFSKGTVAATVDVAGRFEVFTVASVNAGARSMTPSRAFAGAYAAGSAAFEVSADTYYLQEQADRSFTLVRETAAGAVQPIVDDVAELSFGGWRQAGGLRRVSVVMRVTGRSADPHRRIRDRTRHLSISLRNPS